MDDAGRQIAWIAFLQAVANPTPEDAAATLARRTRIRQLTWQEARNLGGQADAGNKFASAKRAKVTAVAQYQELPQKAQQVIFDWATY